MQILLSKELKSTLCSFSGCIFILIFLVSCSALLWIIPGEYNIPENGYASLSPFFSIAPVLFTVLIPALSMRIFSEEKRLDTLSLLYSRPVRLSAIILSKTWAVYLVAILALLPTLTYIGCIYFLAKPVGNVDLIAIAGSYLGLMITIYGFVSIGVFASSLTSNPVVAFILGLLICFGFYFGFDLISGLFNSGKLQLLIRNLGFNSHFQIIQRGLIDSRSIFYILFISAVFYMLTRLSLRRRTGIKSVIFNCLLICLSLVGSIGPSLKFDFTKDKRHTTSSISKELIHKINKPMEVEFYLEGNLNSGFTRLQQYALALLSDFSDISSGKIHVRMMKNGEVNNDYVEKMNKLGMKGFAVNEKGTDGRLSQQIVFPWANIKYDGKELPVSLLVNSPGQSGSENLNTSVELLESQFAEAIHILVSDKKQKIAFLYGHMELNDFYVGDTWDMLSRSFQVDAGVLSARAGELDEYDLVIIAGPRSPFTEREKYILDQYLMNGGKLLILVNGVKLDADLLMEKGETPSMANEMNLGDMLFDYGVRVNPVLVEDMQCLEIPMRSSGENLDSDFIGVPWYFAPLLNPSAHPICKGLKPVKTQFSSTLSLTGNKAEEVISYVLLSTSEHTRLITVPDMISIQEIGQEAKPETFKQKNLPVGVLLEGRFNSVFKNRVLPEMLGSDPEDFKTQSKPTKLIVIASEEVIQNEVYGTREKPQFLPLGYDRYSQTQFGNRDFIMNAVNYMVEDSGLLELKNKKFQLQLLDKNVFYQSHALFLFIVFFIPVIFILTLYLAFFEYRKSRYKRMC